VKTSDLIFSEVKYPGATGQIETLRYNWPPLAKRIPRITPAFATTRRAAAVPCRK